MRLIYQKGIRETKHIEQIHLLDKLTYSSKYLLTIEDYKNRIERNPNQIYIVKNSNRDVVGYLSIIPLEYDAYIRIKNGETDKEVITIENIIDGERCGEYFYFDSIIIDPKYRRYKIGKKLTAFALNDLIKSNTTIKRIIAQAISKGGVKIGSKYDLILKKKLDKNTVVLERTFNKKSYRKKALYKDNEKREIEKNYKVKNSYNY